jgi:exopolysaccharide biosynthesis protein
MAHRSLFSQMKAVFLLLVVLAVRQVGFAQADGKKVDATQITMSRSDQLIEKYGAKLSLTDDQKSRIRVIVNDAQMQFTSQRTKSTSDVKVLEQSKKNLMANADKQIQEVLTQKQLLKYRYLKDQIRGDIRKRAMEVPPPPKK